MSGKIYTRVKAREFNRRMNISIQTMRDWDDARLDELLARQKEGDEHLALIKTEIKHYFPLLKPKPLNMWSWMKFW